MVSLKRIQHVVWQWRIKVIRHHQFALHCADSPACRFPDRNKASHRAPMLGYGDDLAGGGIIDQF
ncbi:hypothetical protein AK972_2324 [Pseudomonas yamanorum]|nr:hypothetical protein AK972_2324 [Pseudomonas yamanorum]